MALTQNERISISKTLVEIPLKNEQADNVSVLLEVERLKAEAIDNSNKNLMNTNDTLISLYQVEIARYDGNGRTILTETDIQNSANKLLGNFFFPNDPTIVLPSLPDGVWKQIPPFAGSKAIGRTYTEGFNAVTSEQSLITAVEGAIITVETFSDVARSTGQKCTGGAPDVISTDAAMQVAGQALIDAVQAWRDQANDTTPFIPTNIQDPNAARTIENDASRDDIAAMVPNLDIWLALDEYDITHGQTTCAGFNSINVNTLNKTQFRADSIADLDSEITDRVAFLATRVSQISGHLGAVNQDLNTGEIISETGFYGNRFRFISMRLDLMSGTLTTLNSLTNGQASQESVKSANENTEQAYAPILTVSLFRAPASGNTTIHVLDASGFSPADSVYVVAEYQSEIAANIVSINGDRVVLDTIIPQKYRESELARLYKEL